MRREVILLQVAKDEIVDAVGRLEDSSAGRGIQWLEAVDAVVASLLAFPFQGAPAQTSLPVPVRRIRVSPFAYWLYYTDYPSVDFQTGDGLEVIYILACRHERQDEPNWGARAPFLAPP